MAKEVQAIVVKEPVGTIQVVPPQQTASTGAKWHNIEPALKWVAVAYAFGFVTVMLYTYRLGIPVLQVIEPVNVWIGAPLAIVAFFLDKVFLYGKRRTAELLGALKEARALRDQVIAGVAKFEVLLTVLRALLVTFFTSEATPFLMGVVIDVVERVSRTKPDDSLKGVASGKPASEGAKKRFLLWTGRILGWVYSATAVLRFVSFVGVLLFIPLACLIYIIAIFPLVPQSLGGGAPIAVDLLVSPEALPKTGVFGDWQPSEVPSTLQTGAGQLNDLKPSIVIPVTLYFRTEHDVYVRKGSGSTISGPIISLSDHVVEGIVFH